MAAMIRLPTLMPVYRAHFAFIPTDCSSKPNTVLSKMNLTAKAATTASTIPSGMSHLTPASWTPVQVSLALLPQIFMERVSISA